MAQIYPPAVLPQSRPSVVNGALIVATSLVDGAGDRDTQEMRREHYRNGFQVSGAAVKRANASSKLS
jgi:hypothetical protein